MSMYEWLQDFPATTPDTVAVINVGLICNDSDRDRVILWGFCDEASFPSASPTARLQTWEYYSGDWHLVTTASAPASASGGPFGMCYDEARSEVVVAVKPGGGGAIQTWTYNGTNWTQKSPAHTPTIVVTGQNLVYDATNSVCVLFGSNLGSVMETWTWDGTDWTQIVTATLMTPWRNSFPFAYYPPTGTCLMFGGNDGGTPLDETWELDVGANTWTQLSPATTPTASSEGYMVYDTTVGQIVMESPISVGVLHETCLWDGSDWTVIAPSPDFPATGPWMPMAFCTEVGKTVGYRNESTNDRETWFFDVVTPNAAAYQRVFGWRAVIDDNALETVELLVSPSAGDA
jgi:hypothetical protein